MSLLDYQVDFILSKITKPTAKTTKTTMDPERKLTTICDELLIVCGALRAATKKMGITWETSETARILNELLDIRNEVNSPAQAKNEN